MAQRANEFGIGKICVVRTVSAGVFFGELAMRDGDEAIVKNARRLWYWDGAASLSQLALEGVKKPDNCKFPAAVSEVLLRGVIEIIPATDVAVSSIMTVPVWQI